MAHQGIWFTKHTSPSLWEELMDFGCLSQGSKLLSSAIESCIVELVWWPQARWEVRKDIFPRIGAWNFAHPHESVPRLDEWKTTIYQSSDCIRRCRLNVILFFHEPFSPTTQVSLLLASFLPSVPLPLNHSWKKGRRELDAAWCWFDSPYPRYLINLPSNQEIWSKEWSGIGQLKSIQINSQNVFNIDLFC